MTQLSHDGQKAYQTLLHAERFEDEAIGYAGELSKLVQAYRILLKEKAADQAFKSLLEKATLAGQLYALCGIYYTDHNLFLILVNNYKVKNEDVQTLFGCIGGKMLASEIVKVNSPTVVRLSYPDQTIDEWIDSHKEIVKNGFLIDIVGGGYPSKFSQKFKSR
jgi:hypothetical protein